jgi:TonB family protein
MKSQSVIACCAFGLVFAVSPQLKGVGDEPILRVGHGVTAPRPLNAPDPEYSEEARRAGLQGKCVLSLIVNSEGKPEDVRVSRSIGMGLDEKSIEALRNWTFEPARKDGKPVAVQISVVMTFRVGKGAALMTPNARAALKRAQKARDEFRRTRVYRVESATTVRQCRSTHTGDKDYPASVSISGLKSDVREYRLESISFTNNKTITNVAALRSLFPIQDGEPFDQGKLAEGLLELGKVYRIQGFVSFKSFVEPLVDDSRRSIALQIQCNEGRQFYVDHINIEGLDEHTFENVRKSLYLRPGDIYNERLANLWLEKNSPLITPDGSPSQRMTVVADDDAGTVVMTYDFRRCAD